MSRFVSMDLYYRYKDEVWRLTNAQQQTDAAGLQRGLSEQEIADRLGLAVEDVLEIRCIVEHEMTPLQEHLDADDTKESRFRRRR